MRSGLAFLRHFASARIRLGKSGSTGIHRTWRKEPKGNGKLSGRYILPQTVAVSGSTFVSAHLQLRQRKFLLGSHLTEGHLVSFRATYHSGQHHLTQRLDV
eukprot:691023-Amorphochlora_amoeboformis.AAC.2